MATTNLTEATELPAVRPLYFVSTFTRPGQWLFWSLWGLLGLTLVALLAAYYSDYAAVVHTTAVADVQAHRVAISTHHFDGRAVSSWAQAYSGYMTLVASSIEVSVPLVLIWTLIQAVGWAGLLAASSRIGGVWGYAIYLVVAVGLISGNGVQLLVGADPYRLATLAYILVWLAPAFAFKQRMLSLALPGQVLLFTGLYLAQAAIAYGLAGMAGIHQVSTFSLPALMMVVLFMLLLLAREPINLLFLLATNSRELERRQPLWVILAVAVLMLSALGLLLARELLGISVAPAIAPVHVLVLALAVGVVTGQNVYHQLRGFIPSQLAYVVFVLSGSLLTAGIVAYGYASAEVLITGQVEWLVAYAFTVIGGLYLVYVLLHFTDYLRRRVNVFYVLMEPPRPTNVRFVVVWFIAITGLVYLEGQNRWRTIAMTTGAYSNLKADNALLSGDQDAAVAQYQNTVNRLTDLPGLSKPAGDLKANYQLASLYFAPRREFAAAGRYYEQAEAFRPFAYARLNHGTLLTAAGRRVEAVVALNAAVPAGADARVHSNRAGLLLQLGEPDSAIAALKRAIALEPGQGWLYANLAQVYLAHDRRDVAAPLLRIAGTMAPNDPRVRVNAVAYELQYPVPDRWPRLGGSSATVDATSGPTAVWDRLNLTWLALRRASLATGAARREAIRHALSVAEQLEQGTGGELGEAHLARLMGQLLADSLVNARSRAEFIGQHLREVRALGYHAVGAYYFGKGVAPMAAVYFGRAAEAGLPEDSLPEAWMIAETGDGNRAVIQLDQFRARYPDRSREVAREVSLLERANGLAEQAQQTWSGGAYTLSEQLRMARYADQAGLFAWAVQALVTAADEDSTTVLPFIAAGRLYREQSDSAALQNLLAGRARRANDDLLRIEIARQYLRLNRAPAARALLDSVAPSGLRSDSLRYEWQLTQATWLAATGQSDSCLALLDRLIAQQPLDERPLQLYTERTLQSQPVAAFDRVNRALDLNDRSPRLWTLAAQLNAQISRPREAAEAAQRAISFTWPEARRRALTAALAQYLEPAPE